MNIKVFGPTKEAAQIESDKWFAKEIMRQQSIPTAEARSFIDVAAAEEYVKVMYKLFESSWRDDAVQLNRLKGVYTDPTLVRQINHKGKFFDVPGPHICQPSPQRTPLLLQAGASRAGKEFADKRPLERYVAESKRLLGVIDIRLDGRQWIMDDEYTIADISMLGWVRNLIGFYEARELVEFDSFREVPAWLERCSTRRAVQCGLTIPRRL